MSRIPQLHDCEFTAEPNGKGYFVGRCRQYPDLRAKPRKDKLDALAEIVSLASEKIRDLDLAAPKPVVRMSDDQCARCGRTDAVFGIVWRRTEYGTRETVLLCHGNPDRSKADPDCYHIVTTGGS